MKTQPVINAKNKNYRTIDTCDSCKETKVTGIMLHAVGATGRVCPVLFLCDKCHK